MSCRETGRLASFRYGVNSRRPPQGATATQWRRPVSESVGGDG